MSEPHKQRLPSDASLEKISIRLPAEIAYRVRLFALESHRTQEAAMAFLLEQALTLTQQGEKA